jgi:hypothetical protein
VTQNLIYLELTVSDTKVQFSSHYTHSSHCMPKPSTPPNSQDAASKTLLSDTTPLKQDICGTEAHTSTPPKKASGRYADMTFDTCDKFVGPMPMDFFLQDFIPEAPVPRPQLPFAFSKASVSGNEHEFASAPLNIDILHADKYSRLRQSVNLGYVPIYTS